MRRASRRHPRGAPARRAGSAQGRAQGDRPRAAHRGRAVHGRVRAGRPFDPGIERARDPQPARPRRPYRRLEARRHAFRRQHHLGGGVPRGSATRASWRWSATSTNVVREGRSPSESEVAKRLRRDHCGVAGAGRGHDLRLERRPHPRRRGRGAGLRPRGHRGRARHGPGDRGRARMRLSRRPARVPPARRLRLPAARQGRRPDHRITGRAARRARPHRRRRASRDHAVEGRPGDLLVARHSRQREGDRGDRQHARPAGDRDPRPTGTTSSTSRAIRAGTSSPRCTLDAAADRRAGAWRGIHLAEHAAFARARGVPRSCAPATAPSCGSRPGGPRSSTRCRSGGSTRTATSLIDAAERAVPERRKLAFAGLVSVAIAIDEHGEIAGDPVIDIMGVPDKDRRGKPIADLIADTVGQVLDSLPKARRRDAEAVEERSPGRCARRSTTSGARSPPAMCSSSRSEKGTLGP